MKMTFNTLLESINNVIDKIIPDNKRHFSSSTKIEKLLGPYKKCVITIYYIDPTLKTTTLFLKHDITDRCLDSKKEEFIEKCCMQTLTEFLYKLYTEHNIYQDGNK